MNPVDDDLKQKARDIVVEYGEIFGEVELEIAQGLMSERQVAKELMIYWLKMKPSRKMLKI